MADALHTLASEQASASHPAGDVWLSASAGTGKTQVLTARVLRLLLHGARPEGILCLTFTTAGAAEMRERIHERLGAWVTMKGGDLAADLKALGEPFGDEMQRHARRLFADLLDARGSGLRIQTIHSFCQSLLGSFPAEADLVPGFRAVDERETAQLHRHAMARLAEAADANDDGVKGSLETLSLELGEDATRRLLERCAATPDVMESLGGDLKYRVGNWLGLGEVDIADQLEEACTDGNFDRAALDCFRAACIKWGTATGQGHVDKIDDWLAMPAHVRVDMLETIHKVWSKQDGEPRGVTSGLLKADPECEAHARALFEHFGKVMELRRAGKLAQFIVAALTTGKSYSRHYLEVKRASAAVDFDDLIRETARLLAVPGIGEWIRYKLDQETDHILIDEAQDTNARQWAIVQSLAEEFYAGSGARGDAVRTLFTVGDHKQAIFGFQGTSPRAFASARGHFHRAISAADRTLGDHALNRSYRSGQAILDIVDGVIDEIGPEALGLERAADKHVSAIAGGSGQVVLWPPVAGAEEESEEADGPDRISDAELDFARDLAVRVKHWTSGGLMLRNKGRTAQPEDVLILVRSRGELARLIVSRLYEANVDVAGIDRLRLNAPIAVQDLLACIRFVLQPDDSLNLAALLVSPLVDWDQTRLYHASKGRDFKTTSLWRHIADERPAELREMLRIADISTPYRFLEAILSGETAGRRRLIARLGEEARDPIEALLNAALDFERQSPPSLQLFIDWFDRGDVDIKRDAAKPERAVRVMTVHGAKGLQAPIVVLADAPHSFASRPKGGIEWAVGEDLTVPMFRPRKAVRAGRISDAVDEADARDLEEHWRLLYVAMTRAEEHLFIGGAIRPRERGKPLAETVWHERVARAMRTAGAVEDAEGLRYVRDAPIQKPRKAETDRQRWQGALPGWLTTPAAAEARPPRPLAPSAALVSDDIADPPPSPEQRAAANRGRLLHALFERLPTISPDQRRTAALRWLEKNAGVTEKAAREELASHAIEILSDPRFASVFTPSALAEAPIAGVVEGQVIAGSVDRLLVGDDQVLVVDFKTGRRVPTSAQVAPRAHLAQMAAYVAVLEKVFPDRPVRAALLYTSGPTLISLAPALLDAVKPGFRRAENKLGSGS